MMESKTVRLVPPSVDQAESFWALTGPDPAIWEYFNNKFETPKTFQDIQLLFESMAATNGKDGGQIFIMQSKATNDYFGISTFMDVNDLNKHLEIGGTFIAPAYRGGATNFEVKLMMLTEAFEVRGCERVTFKANAINLRSRRALEKIGAKFEGILRHHRILGDGTWRDSAYFSILREEWPEVKESLQSRINS